MKKTSLSLMVLLIIFGYFHSLKGQNLTSQQKFKIEKQVDSVFKSMVKLAEYLDYDQISKGVDDRYNAGFISNGTYFSRYDSLITVFKSIKRDGTKQNIKLEKEKITVLSDNLVLLTASGVSRVDLSTGQSFEVNFDWSFVYEKLNNEWKVIQSHQSGKR